MQRDSSMVTHYCPMRLIFMLLIVTDFHSRSFPPVPIIPRVYVQSSPHFVRTLLMLVHCPLSARSDAILPLGSPVKCNDGRTITEIFVPKGTSILINIPAVNTDPGTWGPDAA